MAGDEIQSAGFSWLTAFTHYGAGFVTQGKWWQLGFIMVTVNLIIWLGIGSLWWKVVGLW